MSYLKQNYERLSESLQTSEEILYAIEQVAGENFYYETHAVDSASPYEEIAKNAAFELWENGGRDAEILAALPTEDGGSPVEKEAEIFWGMEGKFAEFDGEKWLLW